MDNEWLDYMALSCPYTVFNEWIDYTTPSCPYAVFNGFEYKCMIYDCRLNCSEANKEITLNVKK